MKLPDNLRKAIEATPRDWRVDSDGKIRRYDEKKRQTQCPLSSPLGKCAARFSLAQYCFHISEELVYATARASDDDSDYDHELRADIELACGLGAVQ